MLYKYGKRMCDFGGVINKTITPLVLVEYEMVHSQLGTVQLVGYLSSHI